MLSSAAARAGVRGASRHGRRAFTRASALRLTAPRLLRNANIAAAFYTTERVLELRSGKPKEQQPRTVYDPTRETENCGVGLVASLKSVPSRRVVEDADEMLVRMSHRGACGCDPDSGDGAGE